MNRRSVLIGSAIFAVFLVAVAVFLVVPALSDSNHVSAVNTVQQAGLKPGTIPGPTWEKP